MNGRIPILTPLADWLEARLVRRFRSQYRWVVRALTALSVLLLVVSGVLFATDQAGLDAGTYGPILELTGVVVSLFVLLGVLQFLLLARAVDRTADEVTAAAEEIEAGADEVVEAATTVEETVEETADGVEDAEVAEVEERTEQAQELGEDAKDVATDAKERLGGAEEEARSGDEGSVDRSDDHPDDHPEDHS